MEDKITLELTVEEVLALREAVEAYEGPAWKGAYFRSLHLKAWQAYKKPVLSQEEYKKLLDAAEEKWKNSSNKSYMLQIEKSKIKFFYKLPEGIPWE